MTTQVVQAKPSTNAFTDFFRFWKDVAAIAGPYWYPTKPGERAFSDVIRAWVMLIFLIILILFLVVATTFNTFIHRYLIDVIIQEKDYSKFTYTISIYAVSLVLITLLVGFSKFIRKQIALDWYQWLNNHILQNLLSRVEGFDTEVPWENILSLGEQQRLAFARLLVTHPRFLYLA